jgi:hypothetical protein
MSDWQKLDDELEQKRQQKRRPSVDAKGKLKLPPKPEHDNIAGLCSWLTAVFLLDPEHPITGAVRQGQHGPEGHVELSRRGALPIRFEPLTRLVHPARLREVLAGAALHTDDEPPGFKAEHTYAIEHVVRMLCGHSERRSDREEALGLVGDFLLDAADPIEGRTTHGDSGQRYEALVALRRALDERTGRPLGPPRYLIDADTGEYVIRVGDLATVARRQFGSLPRGWLDGRMEGIGWRRVEIQGYALPGRAGRQGPHAHVQVYRGHLSPGGDDGAVNP